MLDARTTKALLHTLLAIAMAATIGCGRSGGGGSGGGGGGAGGNADGGQGAGDAGGDQGGAGGGQGGDGQGGDDQGGDDQGGGQGDGQGDVEPGEVLSIIRLQNDDLGGRPADGSGVTLEGVVTAGPNSRGSFNVQSAAGTGPWTGIFIYNPGAPGDDRHIDVEAVAVGKTVTVTGAIIDFARPDHADAGTLTEIRLGRVDVTGDAEVPAASDVDPGDAARGADAEQWEGVLISVGGVTVTDPDLGNDVFEVTGGLRVSPLYHRHTAAEGQIIEHLTGVLHFDYGEYRLAPRSADDVGAQRADLPVVTPSDLQNPAANPADLEGKTLALEGVVVTGGPSDDQTFLFVESADGGAYSGLSVYNNRGGVDLSGIQQGALVNLEGKYQEFRMNQEPNPDTLTQLILSSIEVVGVAEAPPEPEAVTVAELGQPAGAEPWEGVLVVLSGVTVATADTQEGTFTLDGGLKVSSLLHDLAPLPGAEWSTLTGIVHFVDGAFVLVPRDGRDAVE